MTRLDDSIGKSKCLLLLKKIKRIKPLKSLSSPRDKVDISREHPIATSIVVYVSSFDWLHSAMNRQGDTCKVLSDPWMWKVIIKGPMVERKRVFFFWKS